MRILFVKPNMGLVHGKPYLDKGRMEPLTFAVLKGATPNEHDVTLVDDRFEPVPYEDPYDVVAINTEIYTAKRAYEIASGFRGRGVKVVLGGFHTTMIPDESSDHADAIVTGDAEQVWPELLSDIENDNLKPLYQGTRRVTSPIVGMKTDYGIFEGKKYLPVTLSQFSRGCTNQCEYCATGFIYNHCHGTRRVEEVIAEISTQHRKYVFFVDDNLIANKEAAKKLFTALIPLKVRWTGQADLSFADDLALMELMVKSGCKGLVVGFESLNKENLNQMGKNCNVGYKSYDPIVECIRQSGIMIWAAFLLGYDFDTPQSVKETCDWALDKKFAFSAFNILMPYPSTALYQRMREEKRLLYDGKWWLHDDYTFGMPGIKPKKCSPDQLAEACLEARLKHSSLYQILRRSADFRTHMRSPENLLTYFAYNPLFRNELKKKHGMVLGYRGLER